MTAPETAPAVRPGRALPSRHIHLDFHTSPAIPGVGRDFDPEEFADTLVKASVSSITVFAKCHHGMAYYPTEIGVRHPGLDRDLLGEQITALHGRGIQVTAYLSVMYDQRVWNQEGGWRVLDRSGLARGLFGPAGPVAGELGKICLNTPYLDEVTAMAGEVVSRYDVDGLFFDNVQYGRALSDASICFCQYCTSERRAAGIDPDDRQGNQAHMADMIDRSLARMFGSVLTTRPDASVFVNGQLVMGSPPEYLRRVSRRYRHLEIESLPGGDWGYGHFPLAARAMRQYDVELMGMTGAFHRSWGDFGSVRNQAATDYECAAMIAHGTTVAVGDHLHPHGVLNATTYDRIGRTFARIQQLQPWTDAARPVADIGVLIKPESAESAEIRGANAMLSQLRHQFDLVDDLADFSPYRVLILPDRHEVSATLLPRLAAFVAGGGKLLATGRSLGAEADPSARSLFGVDEITDWPYEHQYFELLADADTPAPGVHIAYLPGQVPVPADDGRTLARYWAPYFAANDYEHFQVAQVPPQAPTDSAAIVGTDSTVYIGPNLFTDYATYAYPQHRDVVAALLGQLLPDPVVRAGGPTTLQATVTEQPGRLLVHLMHYVPQTRAPQVEVVEDTLPLYDVPVRVRCAAAPSAVLLAPGEQQVAFKHVDGFVEFTVPKIDGHQLIAIERPAS
ncbi:alpha-amylase family protein [Jiangella muralis]|uniref:alpha-amylase family protein n=1 Tax=Jiangella muralis TaxID=702383 RepID=UPI00069F3D7A|nr:alpha-amylase family protein [Jiangella muralis]